MGVSYFKAAEEQEEGSSARADSAGHSSQKGEDGTTRKAKEIISYLSFVAATEEEGKGDKLGRGEVSRFPLGENAAIVSVRWPATTNQIVAG